MVDSFDTTSGELVITVGGVEKFSTLKKKFNRVPLAKVTLSSYAITFPNFTSPSYNYDYGTWTDASLGTCEFCATYGKFPGQEWGPAALGFSNVLADVDLGPAPAGCDYLDVQVNLTRTTTPPILMNNYVWPIEFKEGQWLNLTDGSLVVEKRTGMARMFWFEIVSGRILLRRKQSISAFGFQTHYIQAKINAPGLNQLQPANANGSGCSTSMTMSGGAANSRSADYTSVYTGTLILEPCSTS